jgi:pyruvate/2-oxoglutarate dehydrogenase complex dihydrolipoamide acyltransferase (E2) component
MTRSARYAALYSTCLAGILLSACGKHAAPPPASQPAAKAVATVPAAKPAPSATAGSATATPPAHSGSAANSVAPAAAASAALSVASVTLGNAVNDAHQVTAASNRFAPDDKTIYASVATTGRSGGATLNARWSYLEGQGQLISNISQAIATDGPAVTTFMVQNPDLWPEGKYKVEISLDGKPVTTQDFEIARP